MLYYSIWHITTRSSSFTLPRERMLYICTLMYHQSSGSLQTIRMFVNLVGKTEPITDEEDAAEYIWFCRIYVSKTRRIPLHLLQP